ncbi:alpha/beta hydrolase [Methylobacterium mesophilicum SR1.6/6]|uniref:Alpha/beta hydrolase n=1 Tax=Methylobacterium mesophilicum SR1.6/6 TaxID=908290 RepID=A0A6B9FRR4_9HYPH|nr:alpha/beta hydrolase [Methylobacterium mesophilicum]QGY05280.1 alpha/beta hydrolase [Methylobacterium mesophilicum SR1.6/6]
MDVTGVSFRRIALPDVTLHVAEAGPAEGPAVILLHGFPEFWYGWRHQIAPLAEAGFRVIVPDQRGYGLSDKPEGRSAYHLDRLAADVVALADACGAPTVRLVGHDWGGLVAWWVASLYPARIERLAILNAPHPAIVGDYMWHHPGQWLRSVYVGLFQLPRLPERLLTADRCRALRHALVRTSRPGAFAPADLERYVAAWRQPGAMTAMLNWYRALVQLERAEPPRVRVPTLILWGKRDTALQAGLAQSSLAFCDDGRIRWYERASHWLTHEEPAAIAADLERFLA